MSDVYEKISVSLQAGDAAAVTELIKKATDDGISAKDILERGLLAAMDIVAEKFKNNEVYIPEVLVAARAMNAGTALLKPYLAESGAKTMGKALIGTVKGDLHDIGKNLVRMMFEGKGIETIDLGIDVSAEKFLEACRAEKPDILALSALLTTTMGEIKNTIDALVEAGIRNNVIIMIGGAPVTENFRASCGADIYAPDAASAADAAKQALLSKK